MRKKLKITNVEMPWTTLISALTGDPAHDAEVILNFTRQSGNSRLTTLSKLKLHGHSTAGVERHFANDRRLKDKDDRWLNRS